MKDKIKKLNKLLSSETKYMICFALSDDILSLNEVVMKIQKLTGNKINRETIYRSLDSMIESNLVNKEYFKDEKEIKYLLKIKRLEINFVNKEILFIE